MLLREADVLLQKRDSRDVARNALVSIFLRHLEYFQGVMFLTTDRVEVSTQLSGSLLLHTGYSDTTCSYLMRPSSLASKLPSNMKT